MGVTRDNIIRKFARAQLGLPYEFSFKQGQTITVENKVENKSDRISRIKSPITFKPILLNKSCRIYILTEDSDQSQILNKPFDFNSISITETLSTPCQPLDLKKLLFEYHNELGESFTAYNFTGNFSKTVKIQP
jgi:hypothetical protein